jgi:glycosyltransferase involved in cell wall biosynthesis
MRFLFLEPYYGGSHREFADGWRERSRHRIELVTLPDRFWKWRLRGAALHLARKVSSPESYDGLIASSMLSLAELRGLWGRDCPPALLYFHENQLTYPVPEGESRDVQFAFTNISSALAAQRVLFNSGYHRRAFFEGLDATLRMMPDYRPSWVKGALEERSGVLYPGCRLPRAQPRPRTRAAGETPLLIWNHRWEFDKDPEAFFRVLYRLVDRGVELRVALLGESFQFVPKAFLEARERLGQRVVQYGFAPDRGEYLGWLGRGDVVVSTAIQENFGIAVVEAIRLGCCPLLPARLSYPELIPEGFHDRCLYGDEEELAARLAALLRDPQACDPALAEAMDRFSWERQIEAFDSELDRLASAGHATAQPQARHESKEPPEATGAAQPRTGGSP